MVLFSLSGDGTWSKLCGLRYRVEVGADGEGKGC